MSNGNNLDEKLNRLKGISEWFDNQEEVDVEEGLSKIKEAAGLIKECRKRLKQIENEFEEVKKEIGEEDIEENPSPLEEAVEKEQKMPEKILVGKASKIDLDDIPF